MEKRRILFVDSDPNVLQGLEGMLHELRQVWDMAFITDPRQALNLLAQGDFDVVVSDIDSAGKQVLLEVLRRHPHIVRIILAGPVNREVTLEAMVISHQCLTKPCDAETLKATISRALALRRLLDGNTPLKALVSRLDTLPSLPSLYHRLVQEVQSPDASIKALAEIIAEDPAMTAKILQLVNSAFFGLRRPVSDLLRAVGLLGMDTIKTLVLFIQVFSQFDPHNIRAYSMESLWRHSTLVGTLARHLAEAESSHKALIDDAFAAGLLHDIGKLILAVNLPNIYVKVMDLAGQEGISLSEAERRLFGAAHGETGAYLLGLWGLPEAIVEAVAYHHCPRDCETPGPSALTFVHTANALSHEFALDSRLSTADPLDRDYLAGLGLEQHLPQWRAIGQELRSIP